MDNQRTVDTKIALGRLAFGLVLLIALIGLVWILFFHHSSSQSQTKASTKTAAQNAGSSQSTQSQKSGAQKSASTGTNTSSSQVSAASPTTKSSTDTNGSANPTTQNSTNQATQLADTGPGDTALIAAVVVAILGGFGHFFIMERVRVRVRVGTNQRARIQR